jgi:hypothetical protein
VLLGCVLCVCFIAGGQINPFKKRERVVFIPPIPEHVWRDTCHYARSLATQFATITPYVSADLVVATDEKQTAPVLGFYTYPDPIPLLLEGPSGNGNDGPRDADDDRDHDDDRNGGGGSGGGGGNGGKRNDTKLGGSGMVIRVSQEFFIPYNRMHALILSAFDSHNNTGHDLRSAESPLVSALIFGLQLVLQWFVDHALSLIGDVPSDRQQFFKFYFSHLKLRAEGLPYPFDDGKGNVSDDIAAAEVAVFVNHALRARTFTSLQHRSTITTDAAGFTIAHYLALMSQFELLSAVLHATLPPSSNAPSPNSTVDAATPIERLLEYAATLEDTGGWGLTPLSFLSVHNAHTRLTLHDAEVAMAPLIHSTNQSSTLSLLSPVLATLVTPLNDSPNTSPASRLLIADEMPIIPSHIVIQSTTGSSVGATPVNFNASPIPSPNPSSAPRLGKQDSLSLPIGHLPLSRSTSLSSNHGTALSSVSFHASPHLSTRTLDNMAPLAVPIPSTFVSLDRVPLETKASDMADDVPLRRDFEMRIDTVDATSHHNEVMINTDGSSAGRALGPVIMLGGVASASSSPRGADLIKAQPELPRVHIDASDNTTAPLAVPVPSIFGNSSYSKGKVDPKTDPKLDPKLPYYKSQSSSTNDPKLRYAMVDTDDTPLGDHHQIGDHKIARGTEVHSIIVPMEIALGQAAPTRDGPTNVVDGAPSPLPRQVLGVTPPPSGINIDLSTQHERNGAVVPVHAVPIGVADALPVSPLFHQQQSQRAIGGLVDAEPLIPGGPGGPLGMAALQIEGAPNGNNNGQQGGRRDDRNAGCWISRRCTLTIVAIVAIILAVVLSLVFTVGRSSSSSSSSTSSGTDTNVVLQAFATPSFYGAEGHGSGATGGRTISTYDQTRLCKVTNLLADGNTYGSLQYCVDNAAFIIFRVTGTIVGDVYIKKPSITIFGISSPDQGITIQGSLYIQSLSPLVSGTAPSNIIISNIRIRPPRRSSISPPEYQRHAISMLGVYNVTLSNITMSGSAESLLHMVDCHAITISWCAFEEPDFPSSPAKLSTGNWPTNDNGNPFTPSGKFASGTPSLTLDATRGITCYKCSHISVHHNLFAHMTYGAPLIDGHAIDIRNNVFYDFDLAYGHAGTGGAWTISSLQSDTGPALVLSANTVWSTPTALYGVDIVNNYYIDRQWSGAGSGGSNGNGVNNGTSPLFIPWWLNSSSTYYIEGNDVDGLGPDALPYGNPWTAWDALTDVL